MNPDPRTPPSRPRPEVLAPAGDPLSFRAALAAGADAVYLGMARFNARGRADRFRGLALESCIRTAHGRGVRVYVTLNTLIHDDELPAALDLAREARDAGADAAIVQDAGYAEVLRERAPDLALHGSTQMSIHGPEGAAEAVRALGLKRIIIARECSAAEVAEVAGRLRPLGAGVEVFVHGALCFAYSGQCLISNFAGRRSANRGICAQNCRFDYACGGVAKGDARSGEPPRPDVPAFRPRETGQLVSLKDLAAFESVAALADAGVEAFKVEGRLKGPEYVAEVVRLYRAALDAWESGRPFPEAEAARAAGRVFSRGFTNGYLAGTVDRAMRGDKRLLEGEPDATVLDANRTAGILVIEPRPGHEVRPGQGYRYVHDRYRGGFRVIAVDPAPRGGEASRDPRRSPGRAVRARVRFGAEASGRRHRRGATGRRRLPPPLPDGLALYLNDDPDLARRIERLVGTVEIAPPPAVGLRMDVSGAAGAPLRARAVSADGIEVETESREPLATALRHPLDADRLAEHLGRLGGTAYRLDGIDAGGLAPGVHLPFPALHELRREIVAALDARRAGGRGDAARPVDFEIPPDLERRAQTALSVAVGSPGAFSAVLAAGAARAIVEDPMALQDPRILDGAWREALAGRSPWFRLPPIVHDHRDDRIAIETIRSRFPSAGVICGHLGQLALAREAGLPAAADLHLNAYNHRTVRLLGRAGAGRVTLSLEVDAREAGRVAGRSGEGPEIEVVAGGRVFSMLTRQDYGLRAGEAFLAVSEHGFPYRFEAGPGRITTMYEGRELVGAAALPLLAGRVDSVRLDLAHQHPAAAGEIAAAYREALDALRGLDGERAVDAPLPPQAAALVARAAEVHRRHAPAGSFEGHLFKGARALDAAE